MKKIPTAQQLAITELVFENQKLKQERDETREHLSATKHFLIKYIAERDEAREQEQIHYDNYIMMKKERDEWSAMCGRYKQERDEARKESEYYQERYEQLKNGH